MLKGLKNAWLSPIGQLVYNLEEDDYELCNMGGAIHLALALHIIKKIKKYENARDWFDNYGGCDDPCEQLEDKGWIKLHTFPGSEIKPRWIVGVDNKITKAQESVILNWCLANNRRYSKAFD